MFPDPPYLIVFASGLAVGAVLWAGRTKQALGPAYDPGPLMTGPYIGHHPTGFAEPELPEPVKRWRKSFRRPGRRRR